MKKIILIIITITSLNAKSQCSSVYVSAECPAQFPKGELAFNKWIEANRTYFPKIYDERIIVKFSVDTAGTLFDVSFLRSSNEMLKNGKFNDSLNTAEKDFERMLKIMPKWEPGRIGPKCNQKICFTKTMPIKFKTKQH